MAEQGSHHFLGADEAGKHLYSIKYELERKQKDAVLLVALLRSHPVLHRTGCWTFHPSQPDFTALL